MKPGGGILVRATVENVGDLIMEWKDTAAPAAAT
jgi:hypothetical protein